MRCAKLMYYCMQAVYNTQESHVLPLCSAFLPFPLTAAYYLIRTRACEKKGKEETTPFGVTLMRSQVLYWAAQVGHVDLETVF